MTTAVEDMLPSGITTAEVDMEELAVIAGEEVASAGMAERHPVDSATAGGVDLVEEEVGEVAGLETDLAMAIEMAGQASAAGLRMAAVLADPATEIGMADLAIVVDGEDLALVVAEVEGKAALVAVIDMVVALEAALEVALEAVSRWSSPTSPRSHPLSLFSLHTRCTCNLDARIHPFAALHLSML